MRESTYADACVRIFSMPMLPKLIAFDLDDTLAPSKSPAPARMIDLLSRLLQHTQVAVISGGNFDQFDSQLVSQLTRSITAQVTNTSGEADAELLLANLHLLPTCGTRYYLRQQGEWLTQYQEDLSETDRTSALTALREEAERMGLWEAETWGPILEDRGSQITFSALGQSAPVVAKQAWDPTGEKKNALRDAVAARLPQLEVRSGGSTSIDITQKGIDKAYGMQKLAEKTGISLDDMLFIGDRLDTDGNDYPVLALGVACKAVTGWEDTADYLTRLLSS